MSQELIEVRCPLKTVKGDKEYDCNKLAVKVTAGASGRAYCPGHKQEFDFEVVDVAKQESFFSAKAETLAKA